MRAVGIVVVVGCGGMQMLLPLELLLVLVHMILGVDGDVSGNMSGGLA